MKNIQVIDSAENCVFDIFAATNAEFRLLFPHGHDVAFADEMIRRNRGRRAALHEALKRIWNRRLPKSQAVGIHGLLFYDLPQKKQYYSTRRDEEACNPDGSRLRQAAKQG